MDRAAIIQANFDLRSLQRVGIMPWDFRVLPSEIQFDRTDMGRFESEHQNSEAWLTELLQ